MTNAETAPIPANLAYSFMTPCSSRGRLHVGFYVLELIVAIFFMRADELFILPGAALAIHALYRISRMKRLKAPCPHCQTMQTGLKENGKAQKCKSCGHQLAIYGTKLADLDTQPGVPPVVAAAAPVALDKTAVSEKKNTKAISGVISLILLGGWLYYCFGGGLEQQAAHNLNQIENKVAADAVTQYGIAARNGNKIDKCVQAGMVAAAFLQAKDEAMYAEWKAKRDSDCATAGLPAQ